MKGTRDAWMQRLSWGLATAAAVTLSWTCVVVQEASAPLPPREIRGALLEMPSRPDPNAPKASEADAWSVPAAGELVDFTRFEFDDYDPPELRGAGSQPFAPADFPESVRVLDGHEIRLEGYPLSITVEEGRVTHLLFARFPAGCCFGSVPVLDEWLLLDLEEELDAEDVPTSAIATGRLEVGERMGEGGLVESLYRLRAARLE